MCRRIGSKNIGFLAGKCTFLVTEEGMLAAVGTQNIDFLAGKCIFLQGTCGGQTNCFDASEAKTLVFLQENVYLKAYGSAADPLNDILVKHKAEPTTRTKSTRKVKPGSTKPND